MPFIGGMFRRRSGFYKAIDKLTREGRCIAWNSVEKRLCGEKVTSGRSFCDHHAQLAQERADFLNARANYRANRAKERHDDFVRRGRGE